MVNLRFHIVSLVAVFLALAIGITTGAAFIDRATVDTLKGRLDQLETSYRERGREIEQFQGRLDNSDAVLNDLGRAGSELLNGRLNGRRVMLVADRGVDSGALGGVEMALAAAGATVSARVWVEAMADASSDGEIEALSRLVEGRDATTLRRNAVKAVAAALDTAAKAGGAVPRSPGLERLASGGLLGLEAGSDGGEGGAAILVVSGPTAVNAPALVSVPLLGALAVAGDRPLMAVELGQPRDGGAAPVPDPSTTLPGRGVFVGPIRDDGALATRVATVDDGEQPGGRLAVPLALQRLLAGVAVHLGEGDGASARLPRVGS